MSTNTNTNSWATGLTQLCTDLPTLCFSTLCYPCAFADVRAKASEVGFWLECLCASTVPCYTCCAGPVNRGMIRTKYGIREEPCGDCIVHTACPCCAIMQETRELQRHKWLGTDDKQKQQQSGGDSNALMALANANSQPIQQVQLSQMNQLNQPILSAPQIATGGLGIAAVDLGSSYLVDNRAPAFNSMPIGDSIQVMHVAADGNGYQQVQNMQSQTNGAILLTKPNPAYRLPRLVGIIDNSTMQSITTRPAAM